MTETTVLDEAHRGQVWASTLTGALYRWDEGWEMFIDIGGLDEWRPYKAGVDTVTVYARAGEKFQEVLPDAI